MSVYTTLEPAELICFLRHYDIGEPKSFSGIASGIINSNYLVATEQGQYILTLFETLTTKDIPFFIDLMEHCADHGLPCPKPIYDKAQNYLHILKKKPTVLLNCLPGVSVETPSVTACSLVGEMLAKLHIVGLDFTQQRANRYGPKWCSKQVGTLTEHLSTKDQQLLNSAIKSTGSIPWEALPKGIIHADLFPDNVLFENETLTGIIDFYLACTDSLAYDLAITAIAWCSTGPTWDAQKEQAMLQAYETIRPLTKQEHATWPSLLQAGALRFWVSRLLDYHQPKEGTLTHLKNPDQMKSLLLFHS